MAPKKGVSFVKVDKITTDADQKPVRSAAPPASKTVKKAKKETSKLNRLAPVVALAGKKKGNNNNKRAGGKGKVAASSSATKTVTITTKNADGTTSTKTIVKRKTKQEKRKCAPYVALQLRNLPDAFQEPQIRKFLCQFGVPIAQTFVQRTAKRATSRGLAYVRFAPKDAEQEKLLDVILDECRAMNLGGKTVTAKWVTMARLMPSRKASDARRQIEYKNKTEGVPLERHNVRHFDWVNKLRGGAKTEAAGNKFLKSIGIDYAFGGFAAQVPLLSEEAKRASTAAQKSVKLFRLATAIGRRKGFSNEKMMAKVINKKAAKRKAQRQRKNEKKKSAKKDTPTAAASATPAKKTATATATTTTTTSAKNVKASAGKKQAKK